MLRRIIFINAVLTVTNAFAQIQIDSNFDSGNIGTYTINGNEIEYNISSDELNYTYWANFKVSGVLNQQITCRITNAGDVPFLSDTVHESQMVYSYNGNDWFRLTDHSYSGGTYTFTDTFTQDLVQIATFFPFSYQQMHDFVDWIQTSEWATETILGSSHQGRDIDVLTITNPSVPAENKKIIYIIGRQHAAETSSSHMLKGMIDLLISDTIHAHRFRNKFIWYIVPMVNPDGVFVGNSRATSEGNDANRDWGNFDTAEINIVRASIDSINNTSGIDMFIDWHSQMYDTRWYNFIYSPTGNTFFPVLSSWTDFDSQSASGPSSCTSSSCTARGWAMNEGLYTFVFEPTPHLVSWSVESLNEQGELTAFAIDDYFDMPEVGPVIYLPVDQHTFSDIAMGDTVSWLFDLRNVGDGDMTISSIISTHTDAFTITDPGDFPLVVQPYDTLGAMVQFHPSLLDSFAGTLWIASDAVNYDTIGVCLYGNSIDETPPEAISNLTADLHSGLKSSGGNIHLSWSEPFDNTGIDYYLIYRNDTPHELGDSLATTTDTIYLDECVYAIGKPNLHYYYTVKAVDYSGNKSEPSDQVGEFDKALDR